MKKHHFFVIVALAVMLAFAINTSVVAGDSCAKDGKDKACAKICKDKTACSKDAKNKTACCAKDGKDKAECAKKCTGTDKEKCMKECKAKCDSTKAAECAKVDSTKK